MVEEEKSFDGCLNEQDTKNKGDLSKPSTYQNKVTLLSTNRVLRVSLGSTCQAAHGVCCRRFRSVFGYLYWYLWYSDCLISGCLRKELCLSFATVWRSTKEHGLKRKRFARKSSATGRHGSHEDGMIKYLCEGNRHLSHLEIRINISFF